MHEPLAPTAVARAACAALLLLAAGSARGAACCMSATSFGVGRLTVWEEWAVGVRTGHAWSVGTWTPGGTIDRNPPGYDAGVSTLEPWAIVRLHERVQLQAWAPLLWEDRRQDGQWQVAGGVGDVGAGVRVELVPIGQYAGLPSFAFTVGGVAPTGRRVEQTRPPLFAGTTGRGAWAGSLALESEYAWVPWFVRLDAGATVSAPFERVDTGQLQRYAPSLQIGLSGGRELVPNALVLAAAIVSEWEGAVTLDGAPVAGSAARSLALAASVSWSVDPRWTLVGTFTNSVWPPGLGMNRDARSGFLLGVRHGHF